MSERNTTLIRVPKWLTEDIKINHPQIPPGHVLGIYYKLPNPMLNMKTIIKNETIKKTDKK